MMLQALLGAGANPINITDRTSSASDFRISPATATAVASYELTNAGVAQTVNTPGGTTTFAGEWLRFGNASDFEVQFTVQSGSFTGGVFGSWQALSVARSISNTATRSIVGITALSGTALVEIRRVGTSVVLDSAVITCTATAEVEP